jgi:predicted transcriptional regulator
MDILENLRSNIINQVKKIESSQVLEEIKRILDQGSDNKVMLSEAQKEAITKGLKQYENGNVIEQQVMEEKLKGWLKEQEGSK